MIFILLTFLTAFLIEGLGTIVSVIGLSTLFGANPIIIALAIALDVGKLVVVSMLYKFWGKMKFLMKSYALIAATVTMLITSAGAAGYLTGEFQKAIVGTQETSLKVDVLKQQQAKYEERKRQIDDQIANLPSKTTVNQRIRMMKQFQDEQKALQVKIEEIDTQLPELQMKQIGVEAKAGPILYISKAFDVPVEVAVKYVVLMIIFVFDPLAVFLIVAGNFLLGLRDKEAREKSLNDELIEKYDPGTHSVEEPVEKVPNEETRAAMAEADRIVELHRARELVGEADRQETEELLKMIETADFKEPVPEPPVEAEVTPIVEVQEPIAEPEQEHQVSPVGPLRQEIKLEDLKPHRSSLNSVAPDAHVTFTSPRSTSSDFYGKNS